MSRILAAGAALALALGAAACGGGDGDGGAQAPATASVSPPDALFGNVAVRPEGETADAAGEALSKLLDTDDPGAFLVEQLDGLLAQEDAGITYAQDIEPWLGENVGAFVTTFSEEPDVALVAEVTDQGAAQETVDALRAFDGGKTRDETHEGVSYQVDEDGGASGFVDDFLVVGTEAAFRSAVDASGGDSLADDEAFTGQYEALGEDALVALYADLPEILDRVRPTRGVAGEVRSQLGAIADGPVLASVATTADAITLEAATQAGELPIDGSDLLGGLPAGSWFALALPAFGKYLADAPRSGVSELDAALRSLLGSDLDELTSWIGDAAGFATGSSLFEIRAALSVQTEDETASANALGALGKRLSRIPSLRVGPAGGSAPGFTVTPGGSPIPIVVTQRDGQVVVGLGQASIDDLLEPDPSLGDSDRFAAATEALGPDEAPGAFLDFPPLLELAKATGATDGDPGYRAAKPYLDHLDYLVLGGHRDDDKDVSRAVLGLR